MKLLHGQAKVLYFLWLHEDFKGSIPQLSDRLGYPDDRYIRGIVQDLEEEGYLTRKLQKDGTEFFQVTSQGKNQISFLTLPTWAFRALILLGILISVWGIELYNGVLQFNATSEIGIGLVILAMGLYLVVQRRQSFEALWPAEGEGQSSPKERQKDLTKGQADS